MELKHGDYSIVVLTAGDKRYGVKNRFGEFAYWYRMIPGAGLRAKYGAVVFRTVKEAIEWIDRGGGYNAVWAKNDEEAKEKVREAIGKAITLYYSLGG